MFTDDHKVRVLHTQVGKHAKDAVVPARDYGHDVFRLADIGAVAWEGEPPPRPSQEEIDRAMAGPPPHPDLVRALSAAKVGPVTTMSDGFDLTPQQDPALRAEVDDLKKGLMALTQDLDETTTSVQEEFAAQRKSLGELAEQVAVLQDAAQGKSRKH